MLDCILHTAFSINRSKASLIIFCTFELRGPHDARSINCGWLELICTDHRQRCAIDSEDPMAIFQFFLVSGNYFLNMQNCYRYITYINVTDRRTTEPHAVKTVRRMFLMTHSLTGYSFMLSVTYSYSVMQC